MRVAIESIPEVGRVVSVTEEAAWAAGVVAEALEAPAEEIRGQLRLTRRRSTVDAAVELTVRGVRQCERCGDDTPLVLTVAQILTYLREGQAGNDVELESGDLDVGWYSGDAIDLADVVSEAVALELPSRVVCEDREACEARTAALLADHGSSGDATHPALAALKDIG